MPPFMTYSDIHKLFLQTMMFRKKIQTNKALNILKEIANSEGNLEVNKNDLNTIILLINKHISDFNLTIKEMHCEIKDRDYLVLICTVGTLITRKQNKYNSKEIELFRKIVHELITSKKRVLSVTSCINLSIKIDNFGALTLAENVIHKFVKDDWFLYLEKEDGFLTFTVKAIAEFKSYFTDNYKDYIKHCGLCNNIVLHGKTFSGCNCFFHLHCLKIYKNTITYDSCPKCVETSSNSSKASKKSSLKRKLET